MRVLLVTGTYPPGACGVGDYVSRLAQSLAESALGSDLQVGVITGLTIGDAPYCGVDVFQVAKAWAFSEWPAIAAAIRAWKPDLVHLHYPSQGFGRRLLPTLLPLLCKKMGLPVVQTWHEPWTVLMLPRLLAQRAALDGLIFVRPNYMELLPAMLRPLASPARRLVITSAGALPASRLSADARASLRERYLRGAERLVVFFGFVHPAKGVDELLEIASPRTDELIIAGPTPDPAYVKQIKARAVQLGWGDRLKFAGFLPKEDAADLLACADALVLPFVEGGGSWNTSIHAGLAQGTLVITTAAQPNGDDPERNLYTARISDVREMKAALNALSGRRVAPPDSDRWPGIARAHADFYELVYSSISSR